MDSNLCMLKYYKKHIFLLKNKLNELEPTSNDFIPLLELQQYIIERILDTEHKIKIKQEVLAELKKSLKNQNNTKIQSKEIKSKIKKANNSINGYKYLLYVWRCFGDGIVFKYVNKWNLKRLLFESDSPEIKQTSGFIGGKTGIKKEWSLIKDATSNNVPAILCDITNTIRHGDICLLGGSDPYVIEVKSSTNTNKRVDRQVNAIDTIHSYLNNDEGNIGGVEGMCRVDIPVDEVHHNNAINTVIVSAMKGEAISLSPEPGLYYIGLKVGTDKSFDELFKGIKEPVVYMLNQAKTDKRWINYYPFTLSIETPESLYAFLNGEVFLLVVLDGVIIKELSKEIGYNLEIIMSEGVGFIYTKKIEGLDEPFKEIASEHYVGRLGMEFQSLKWFFQKEKHLLAEIEKSLNGQVQNA